MPARLIVYPPFRPARVWSLTEGEDYSIGRQGGNPEADIPIDDDRISRRHAVLRSRPAGAWSLADAGSKNGVELEGRAIQETELRENVWISLGGVLARFELLAAGQVAKAARDREQRWQASATMQRALEPSLGVEGLLERLLDSVLELSDTDRGFVLFADRTGRDATEWTLDDLQVAATRGVSHDELAGRSFLGSSGVVRKVLRGGRATACCDAAAETWLGSRASVLTGGIRALVCLPLRAEQRLLGVVYADSREAGASISDHDLEVLAALADHAALALSLAQIDREIDAVLAELAGLDDEGKPADGAARSHLVNRLSGLRVSARAAAR